MGANCDEQLFLTMLSPWNWFCSTRTFSNCVETTLTVAALDLWPWEVIAKSSGAEGRAKSKVNIFSRPGSVGE